ncbi:MAG: aminotransferase class III-fold pyridoxal phosphate-dependent enzyme [Acidobacteriota bacterium]|nr:aminotransferase class III-fold pyridoxal phosphate-dependent enzyme [Acidobacteriota bacterium]
MNSTATDAGNAGRKAHATAGAASVEDRRLGTWAPRRPIPPIVRGEGCELIAENGDRYLDLTAGYGVCCLGYNHPAIVDAIKSQADRLTFCPLNVSSAVRAEYVEALAAVLPATLDRVFPCNSGTEAVEGALKFAALVTRRSQSVALRSSFHGRTLGALAMTWNPAARRPYDGLLHDAVFVQPEAEAIEQAVSEETAAVVLEPVQGEGGAYGGRVAEALRPGSHGSTYGGNPLACAAGLAVVETLRRLDLPERAAAMGGRFADSLRSRFASNPRVREVRGRGLMIGVVLRERAGRHIARLATEHRILALPAGPNVIRLLPPLTVTEEELERGAEAIQAVLGGE